MNPNPEPIGSGVVKMTATPTQTTRPDHAHARSSRLKKAVAVGLGNTGSHLVGHLARMDCAAQITLIDPDRYEITNLTGQDIRRADVGRSKVAVQARRARRIARGLEVTACAERVEDLPLLVLEADVIFSCVDNRAARRHLAEAAWRLGVPLIDGAVDGAALMGRVGVYVPGPGAACLLCSWCDEDHALEAQDYPCGGSNAAAPTRAPAELGAVVAGMMAVEGRVLLGGPRQGVDAPRTGARYLLFDLRNHVFEMTTITRNPRCRFDHAAWDIEPVHKPPSRLSVGELLRRAAPEPCHGRQRDHAAAAALQLPVPAQGFAQKLVCPQCSREQRIDLRLEGRIPLRRGTCARCGARMQVSRFDVLDSLEGPELRAEVKARTRLSHLGFVAGDVVAVVIGGVTRHFELGAGSCGAGSGCSESHNRSARGPARKARRLPKTL